MVLSETVPPNLEYWNLVSGLDVRVRSRPVLFKPIETCWLSNSVPLTQNSSSGSCFSVGESCKRSIGAVDRSTLVTGSDSVVVGSRATHSKLKLPIVIDKYF